MRLWAAAHAIDDMYQGLVPASVPYFVLDRHYSYVAASGLTLAATLGSSLPQPVIGLLVDSNFADAAAQVPEVQAAADAAGLKLVVLHAGSPSDIDAAFATLVAQRVGALAVGASAFSTGRREQLIELAARHAIPAFYAAYELTADGGLASYGHSASDAFRRAGVYTGWILQGAIAAALPVLQSSKFELVINLRTAKTLGLDVPPNLLAGADQVIQ